MPTRSTAILGERADAGVAGPYRWSGGMCMNSLAHISFVGGGLLLPAQDPYERELLVEHVVACARKNGGVRVTAHGRAWSVRRIPETSTGSCGRCGGVLQGSWCSTAPGGAPHCLRCAFGVPDKAPAVATEAEELRNRIATRRAGAAPGAAVLAAVFQWAGVPLGRTAA
jgi:hypothetical protein